MIVYETLATIFENIKRVNRRAPHEVFLNKSVPFQNWSIQNWSITHFQKLPSSYKDVRKTFFSNLLFFTTSFEIVMIIFIQRYVASNVILKCNWNPVVYERLSIFIRSLNILARDYLDERIQVKMSTVKMSTVKMSTVLET